MVRAKAVVLRDVLHDFNWLVREIASEKYPICIARRLVLFVYVAFIVKPVSFVRRFETYWSFKKKRVLSMLTFSLLKLLIFFD